MNRRRCNRKCDRDTNTWKIYRKHILTCTHNLTLTELYGSTIQYSKIEYTQHVQYTCICVLAHSLFNFSFFPSFSLLLRMSNLNFIHYTHTHVRRTVTNELLNKSKDEETEMKMENNKILDDDLRRQHCCYCCCVLAIHVFVCIDFFSVVFVCYSVPPYVWVYV